MEEEIRDYISSVMLRDDSVLRSVDDRLFSAGLLDSFSMVELLSYLHERYEADIDPTIVGVESLDTPALIAQLIRSGGRPL